VTTRCTRDGEPEYRYSYIFHFCTMKCARKFVNVLQCAANQKSLRTTGLYFTASNGTITGQTGKDLEGDGRGLIQVLFPHISGGGGAGDFEQVRKTSSKVVPVAIRNQHRPNTGQQSYHYTTLLDNEASVHWQSKNSWSYMITHYWLACSRRQQVQSTTSEPSGSQRVDSTR
jgi:hypothetical protein